MIVEMNHVLIAVFLYFMASALLIAEVFVPSAGILTVCALASLAGGIAMFFLYGGPAYGITGIAIAAVLVPVVLATAYKVFPRTSFGKSILLAPPNRTPGDAVPDMNSLEGLLGKRGVVISPLRPVGMCDFSGLRLECVAESGYVKKGETVEVIRVVSTQLTVRVVDES